jgi:hypothetical protein
MKAPTESRWGRLGEMPRAAWLPLTAWLAGSLLWIAYWVSYFHDYCDFDGTFACVIGGFLETVFYSVPQVLARVLGPPALALILGFAAHRAVRARAGREHPRRERLDVG